MTQKTSDKIIIDGRLDEAAWNLVDWNDDFVQQFPKVGEKPSERTTFKILYDDKNLYVGIRAYDSSPDKIVKRMSRRDGFDGDWVKIHFDSYDDKRTAFAFTATVAGVKGDQYISNNGDNWDSTWDPIWYLKTSVDNKGWVAEMKIPLTQLRFATKVNSSWGLQVERKLYREDEYSHWSLIGRNTPGWVHLFGRLNGLKNLKSQKQLEIQPYFVTGINNYQKEENNPFKTGSDYIFNAGADAKIGLTSNVTLDLTVNPDFGQVDADPSTVNLTALEQFFQERRPFFLEGSNLFDFYISGGNNLFYSRRIGKKPSGSIDSEIIKYKDFTPKGRILGSAKITGKNKSGFSWGILESFTNKLNISIIDTLGNRRSEKIEPYTNYLVARAQQELNEGNTIFGFMATNVNRMGNSQNDLDKLHDNAQSFGFDFAQNFNKRKYKLNLSSILSHVEGSEKSILTSQTSFVRNFQRLDNGYREVDSTLTSLTGSAIQAAFGKVEGKLRWRTGVNYRSPKFDINDIGFLSKTDIINVWGGIRYNINETKGIWRNQNYSSQYEQELDFGLNNLSQRLNADFSGQFTNFWRVRAGLRTILASKSNTDLRGGTSIAYNKAYGLRASFTSNYNRKFSFGVNGAYFASFKDKALNFYSYGVSFNYRPIDALNISLKTNFKNREKAIQYITQVKKEDGTTDYLLGKINQKTLSSSLRINYNITPNLTIEFWGQPFIAKGRYSAFKKAKTAYSNNFKERFSFIDRINFNLENNNYEVLNSSDNRIIYDFENPDFSNIRLLSNMVLRWEYIPGSTLFFAWSSNGSSHQSYSNQNLGELSNDIFSLGNKNTLILKYTYRFIL